MDYKDRDSNIKTKEDSIEVNTDLETPKTVIDDEIIEVKPEYQNSEEEFNKNERNGFWASYYELCKKINHALEPLIEKAVNTSGGEWALLIIGGIFAALGKLNYNSNFLASVLGGFIVAFVLWSIQKFLVKYVSRKIGFGYGYELEYKDERNVLVAFAVSLNLLITSILSLLSITAIPILSTAISAILQTISISSIFNKQLQYKYTEKFSKNFLIYNILLSILVVFVLGAIFFAIMFRVFGGLNAYQNFPR